MEEKHESLFDLVPEYIKELQEDLELTRNLLKMAQRHIDELMGILKQTVVVVTPEQEKYLNGELGYEILSWHTSYKAAEEARMNLTIEDVPYGTLTGDEGTVDLELDDEVPGVWLLIHN